MDTENLPTKRNLMHAKEKLKILQQGHDLLEKKQKVLQFELNRTNKKVYAQYIKLHSQLENAKQLLQEAQLKLGHQKIQKIIENTPRQQVCSVYTRSIFGVQIYDIAVPKKAPPHYSIYESSTLLDETYCKWQDVKITLLQLAVLEATSASLSSALKKAKIRTAALKNMTIPLCEQRVSVISSQLEERERDELVRMLRFR